MKSVLFLLAMISLTTACSGGLKSSNGGNLTDSLSTEPKGFKANGPATPNPIVDRFKNGCIANGDATSSYAIDSRLMVGQEFQVSTKIFDKDGNKSLVVNKTITAVNTTSIAATLDLVSQKGFGFPQTFNEVCLRTGPNSDNTFDWDCNEPPSTLTPSDCSITTTEFTHAEIPGMYKGRDAFWTTDTTRGPMTCGGVAMGDGIETYNLVYSNEIPGLDVTYCGGSQIFFGYELKLKNGKVIESLVSTLDGPAVQ